MAQYAQGTTIAVSQTINDIHALLVKFGIKEFGQMAVDGMQVMVFRREGVNYKIDVPYPDPDDCRITHTPNSGQIRTKSQQKSFYDKEVQRRMRALLLVIKAKLVAVEEEIVSFESEFLSYAVMSDGRTLMEHARPALESAGSGGPMMLALPGGSN